jgi:hypothetical protein
MTQPGPDTTETRSRQGSHHFAELLKDIRASSSFIKKVEYKRHVSHTLLSPVSRRLGLRRPRLIHSVACGTGKELGFRLEELMERYDLYDVELPDAIVSGMHEDEPAYAVVEISLTIGDRDITRAADRAATLQEATGVKTFAVAIGENIPAHQETRANAMNVALIQLSE